MARIPLLGGAYMARSIIANAQREVNLYPEKNQSDAPVPVTHYPTAGLRLLKGIPLYTPPAPHPPSGNVVWAVTSSCKFLPYTLGATGDTAPLIALTADDPLAVPPTGEFTFRTFDIDVDAAGNQYMLRCVTLNGVGIDHFEINVYAPGSTGWDPPPTKKQNVTGASTNLSAIGNGFYGGICLDDTATFMYVANSNSILRFPAGADGDASGTILVDHASGVIFTRIYYDTPRSLLWVSCGAGDGPGIRAYDLSGTLIRSISCSEFWSPRDSVDSVAVDSNGFIYGAIANSSDDHGQFGIIVYVFAPAADGDSVPVRRLQIEPGGLGVTSFFPCGVDYDKTTGNVYVCYQSGDDPPVSHILSVPNVDGFYTPSDWVTNLFGTDTLLDFAFGVEGVIDAVQQIRIIYHYP